MTLYKWSQTASADATADSTINWAEGQAPSSVNDSARAMMAATAKYRDDIAGAIVTTGSSTAYAASSYQVFDTLAHLSGQMIAFTPHVTNAATVTLNVDSLGGKPLRSAPGVELQAGTIIQGTPYVAVYNDSDGAFYLQNFFGNPYNVPIGAGLDFWGATAPNSSFAFPVGQAISRSTYPRLFALIGTTYGGGDGSTTFNLPDKRGRVSAGKDDMNGAAAGRLSATYFGGVATNLGAVGGAESHTLSPTEIPTITSSVTVSGPNDHAAFCDGGQNSFAVNGGPGSTLPTNGGYFQNLIMTGSGTSNNTGGGAHSIVQPTIVCNYILRVF